jgi:hypothetical protein
MNDLDDSNSRQAAPELSVCPGRHLVYQLQGVHSGSPLLIGYGLHILSAG